MDIDRIRELLAALAGTDVRRLTYDEDGVRIEVEREIGAASLPTVTLEAATAAGPGGVSVSPSPPHWTPVPGAPPASAPSLPAAPVAVAVAPAPSPASAPAPAPGARLERVRSPFVGTFYRAAGPGAGPFTAVGDRVRKGDTLCIVEAMKLMNEIESEWNGVVREILVKNEAAVQFGQELFLIEVGE